MSDSLSDDDDDADDDELDELGDRRLEWWRLDFFLRLLLRLDCLALLRDDSLWRRLRLERDGVRDLCSPDDDALDLAAREDFLRRWRWSSESLSSDTEAAEETEALRRGDRAFVVFVFSFCVFFSDVFMGGGLGIPAQMLNAMASRSRLRSSKNSSVPSPRKRL